MRQNISNLRQESIYKFIVYIFSVYQWYHQKRGPTDGIGAVGRNSLRKNCFSPRVSTGPKLTCTKLIFLNKKVYEKHK